MIKNKNYAFYFNYQEKRGKNMLKHTLISTFLNILNIYNFNLKVPIDPLRKKVTEKNIYIHCIEVFEINKLIRLQRISFLKLFFYCY